MGLRFFSRLPTGAAPHEPPDLNRIALALPFASLVIAAAPALLLAGGGFAGMPALFLAGLALALSALVGGAMAEDAAADAADGLFGGSTPEQRLEIFRDSRHGTYGVLAIVLFVLLRAGALAALLAISPLAAGCLFAAAAVLSRSGALWLSLRLPPARADGAAHAAGRVRPRPFWIGAGFAVLLCFILAAPFVGVLGLAVALALAAVVAAGWAAICRRMVGGQTGDLTGALQALLEIAALSTFMLFVRGS